ncbi:mitochondrial carrier [Xylaria sp. FL0064]|nr:mitochondrial carrier [Xylaria sp. FL0064]
MEGQDNVSQSYLQQLLEVIKSADFWAGWTSGAVGIMVGNSLDRRKVLLQAQTLGSQTLPVKPPSSSLLLSSSPSLHSPGTSPPAFSLILRYVQSRSLLAGAAAPSLGAGALNAVLYTTYNRTEDALNRALLSSNSTTLVVSNNPHSPFATTGSNLGTTWLAGAAGGLAIWLVSTPTELVKCKVQLASIAWAPTPNQPSSSLTTASGAPPLSSWNTAKAIFRSEGTRGLYRGGVVTALRDSIGYGFYFWAFELGSREMASLLTKGSAYAALPADTCDTDSSRSGASSGVSLVQEAIKTVFCGGIAGVVTWASVFPLDVVKTRVQTQVLPATPPLRGTVPRRKGAMRIARELYITEGSRAFFRGLAVCSVRAFFVNAIQWPIYKVVLFWLSQSNHYNRIEEQFQT